MCNNMYHPQRQQVPHNNERRTPSGILRRICITNQYMFYNMFPVLRQICQRTATLYVTPSTWTRYTPEGSPVIGERAPETV